MSLLEKTKEICRKYDIRPARSRGQNFLINESVYNKIVVVADLSKDDVVLEVGPGLGFLTERLAKGAKKVVAVELDDKLAVVLRERLEKHGVSNVKVVNESILDFNLQFTIRNSQFKVVANLPYNITSIFLRKFLSSENKPQTMTLMLQKEVAERIVAKAGKMSLLAVSVQFYADAKIIVNVPARDFWPSPKVDSAVIQLKIKNEKLKINEKDFFRLVKFGFSAKRKMLKNNLAGGYQISQTEAEEKIKKVGLNPKIRAQELSVDDWVELFCVLN